MSKRAEEMALKAYPKEDGKVWHSAFGTLEFDKNAPGRTAYRQGYEQAEKDLALTWEDAVTMVTVAMDVIGEGKITGEQNIYTEVLRRFNSQREKK